MLQSQAEGKLLAAPRFAFKRFRLGQVIYVGAWTP
jgi:hypothetical protein